MKYVASILISFIIWWFDFKLTLISTMPFFSCLKNVQKWLKNSHIHSFAKVIMSSLNPRNKSFWLLISDVKYDNFLGIKAVFFFLLLWLIHSSRNKSGFFWSAVPMAGFASLDGAACDFEEQLVSHKSTVVWDQWCLSYLKHVLNNLT